MMAQVLGTMTAAEESLRHAIRLEGQEQGTACNAAWAKGGG